MRRERAITWPLHVAIFGVHAARTITTATHGVFLKLAVLAPRKHTFLLVEQAILFIPLNRHSAEGVGPVLMRPLLHEPVPVGGLTSRSGLHFDYS